MPAHLSISDTQVTIGEERLVVSNPQPSTVVGVSTYLYRLNALEMRVLALEERVIELSRRTWWSMLKDWIHGLRLLPFHNR